MPARTRVNLRLSKQALDQLGELGKRWGHEWPSESVERLIRDAHGAPDHYFTQQAAFQSFMTFALTTMLVRHQLRGDPKRETQLLEQANKQAAMLFGRPPLRDFPAPALEEGLDPRLVALMQAWDAMDLRIPEPEKSVAPGAKPG